MQTVEKKNKPRRKERGRSGGGRGGKKVIKEPRRLKKIKYFALYKEVPWRNRNCISKSVMLAWCLFVCVHIVCMCVHVPHPVLCGWRCWARWNKLYRDKSCSFRLNIHLALTISVVKLISLQWVFHNETVKYISITFKVPRLLPQYDSLILIQRSYILIGL